MGLKGKPNFERTLREMKVGETGYVTPWSLGFDKQGFAYLHLGATFSTKPQGTVSMPVTRTGNGLTDYDINLNFDYFGRKYEFTKKEDLFSGIVGVNPENIVMIQNSNEVNNKRREISGSTLEDFLGDK